MSVTPSHGSVLPTGTWIAMAGTAAAVIASAVQVDAPLVVASLPLALLLTFAAADGARCAARSAEPDRRQWARFALWSVAGAVFAIAQALIPSSGLSVVALPALVGPPLAWKLAKQAAARALRLLARGPGRRAAVRDVAALAFLVLAAAGWAQQRATAGDQVALGLLVVVHTIAAAIYLQRLRRESLVASWERDGRLDAESDPGVWSAAVLGSLALLLLLVSAWWAPPSAPLREAVEAAPMAAVDAVGDRFVPQGQVELPTASASSEPAPGGWPWWTDVGLVLAIVFFATRRAWRRASAVLAVASAICIVAVLAIFAVGGSSGPLEDYLSWLPGHGETPAGLPRLAGPVLVIVVALLALHHRWRRSAKTATYKLDIRRPRLPRISDAEPVMPAMEGMQQRRRRRRGGRDPRAQVLAQYGLVLEQAELVGVPRAANQTPVEYAQLLSARLPEQSEAVATLTHHFTAARYGDEPIPAGAAAAARRAGRAIRKALEAMDVKRVSAAGRGRER